jgi:hypothetical protein
MLSKSSFEIKALSNANGIHFAGEIDAEIAFAVV